MEEGDVHQFVPGAVFQLLHGLAGHSSERKTQAQRDVKRGYENLREE